ncbi:hypothetical protein FF2_046024 [Malus domestica]
MDDIENDARPIGTDYADDEEEDETDDDEELGEEKEDNNGQNGYPSVHKGVGDDDHEDDSDDEEDKDDEEDNKMMMLGVTSSFNVEKKSLRSEEWQEVAEKVSEVSKIERTATQCRNQLDRLKKKYKKERAKFAKSSGATSKWVYFTKMDMFMSSLQQQASLSCGLDSGEYVFMNPKVYLNRANGLDEMRDSPGNSESAEGGDDDSDGLPPKTRRYGRENDDRGSFRLLADSIQKFSNIYEKIENSKRKQMVELEKMRMDFHIDLNCIRGRLWR